MSSSLPTYTETLRECNELLALVPNTFDAISGRIRKLRQAIVNLMRARSDLDARIHDFDREIFTLEDHQSWLIIEITKLLATSTDNKRLIEAQLAADSNTAQGIELITRRDRAKTDRDKLLAAIEQLRVKYNDVRIAYGRLSAASAKTAVVRRAQDTAGTDTRAMTDYIADWPETEDAKLDLVVQGLKASQLPSRQDDLDRAKEALRRKRAELAAATIRHLSNGSA